MRGVYERIPDSGEWWIRYRDSQGRDHREKAGTWAAARDLYIKRKQEALIGKKLPERLRDRPATFAEIAEAAREFIKSNHRRPSDGLTQLDRAIEWFGSREAASISPAEINATLSSAGRWAPSTFNHHLNVISRAYRLALSDGRVAINPARHVQRRPDTNIRQGFIDDAQYRVLSVASEVLWLRTMLALGYTYGWRAGELAGLRVAQVDSVARTIRLNSGTTKNTDGRVVKLTGECFELVSACVEGKQPSDHVLTREKGQHVKNYRSAWEQLCASVGLGRFICGTCKTQGPVTTAVGRACLVCSKAKRRGIFRYTGILFHDLRRSAVRNLERAGVSRSVAMKISGHRTESIYRRYAIVSEADLAEAVTRLERVRPPAPEPAPATLRSKGESAKVN